MTQPSLLLLVGPTGVGKTAVAVELCELLNGEIVSADSMQIYRRCDIGTAKPSPHERARAVHHLIDIHEPTERYSAAEWAIDAGRAIEDIVSRGRQPIIVGGTGFYLRALLQPESLAAAPPNVALRTHLEHEAAERGAAHLHDRLAQLDAAAAQRLHPNDVRRVIRAIEVAVAPGETRSRPSLIPRPLPLIFGLDMPRDILYQRLEARIDTMLEMGFLDELCALSQAGVPPDAPALQGVGYRQMLPVLSDPHDPHLLARCVALWKRDTRRYAKRQLTWFRHQLPVRWQHLAAATAPLETARTIARDWQDQARSPRNETTNQIAESNV